MAEEFEEFWQSYPRRIAKKAARKSYERARREADHATIMAGVHRYAEYCRSRGTDPQYIAHPTTWLNQGRWDDELDVGGGLARGLVAAIGARMGAGPHRH